MLKHGIKIGAVKFANNWVFKNEGFLSSEYQDTFISEIAQNMAEFACNFQDVQI